MMVILEILKAIGLIALTGLVASFVAMVAVGMAFMIESAWEKHRR